MLTELLSCGCSAAAQHVDQKRIELVGSHFEQSAVLSKQTAYSELAQIWQECSQSNWDGDGAISVSPITYLNAYRVIQSLPLGHVLPAIGAEPDGDLTLEWYNHPRWILSISVSQDATLHYAALLGENDIRGSEVFSRTLSTHLLGLISQIVI